MCLQCWQPLIKICPPAFIISAEYDGTRDDSVAYTHALLKCGVPTTHVRYAGMVHTFFSMRDTLEEAVEAHGKSRLRCAALSAVDYANSVRVP